MAALLHDVAVLHHEDDVSLPDGGKAVCHDEAGAALHHPGKGCLDTHLGAGVDGGGALTAILRDADLVKFAKATPPAEENEADYLKAYYFVEETKPVEEETPAGEADPTQN